MFTTHRLLREKWVFIAVLFLLLSLVISGGQASAEKLIWGDGEQTGSVGYEQDIPMYHGGLYYVDPAVSPVAGKTLVTDVDFLDGDQFAFPSATLDSGLNMSNLKVSYVTYMKDGSIYMADTSTLAVTRLSTETGLSLDNICQMRTLVDWKTPAESTIFYVLKGPSASCNDGDDVNRAVRLNMTSSSSPVAATGKYLMVILLDGRYVLADFTGSPWKVRVCNKALGSCSFITSFVTDARPMHFDASRVILRVDGSLMSYQYTAPVSKTALYTISPGKEEIREARLDKDGSVYFMVIDLVGDGTKYTHSIKRVASTGGAVTTLSTFTTAQFLNRGDFSLSSSYVVYSYPNSSNNGAFVRSVNKTGTSVKTLATASVNGGVVGSRYYFEDKDGKVHRIGLNGSGLISLADAQLTGASYGGSGNWFYGLNSSTFRGIINVGNVLKSFSYADTFASPGIILGDLPVNLSNPAFMQFGAKLIGTAGRRGTEYSKGKDVIYIDTATAGSFQRVTNNNGIKVLPEVDPH
ncbi:MAG: hypothetical protein AB9866_07915 [Syntrophobacteraceae bacterium]